VRFELGTFDCEVELHLLATLGRWLTGFNEM